LLLGEEKKGPKVAIVLNPNKTRGVSHSGLVSFTLKSILRQKEKL
jgi:hypothetical protein